MPRSKLNIKIKISWNYLVKGVIYAAALMLGTLLGVLMRKDGAQGFSIWGVVGTINVLATLFVFYMLKADIKKAQEQKKEPSKFESSKDKKEKKASAKIEEIPAPSEKVVEDKAVPEPAFETEADKKV